ncbi:hypothetical protein Tco_0231780 [Tanacetum coccineum]
MDDPNMTMEEYIKLEEEKARRMHFSANLKSEKDINDNNIDIIQSTEGNGITHRMLLCFIMNLYVPFGIPFDPKRYYKDGDCAIMLRRPRYQGLEYTDADIADFEERLERIYGRKIHMVQVIDFLGMPELMRDGLFTRMVMEHRDDAVSVRRSQETIELEAVYSGLGITHRGGDGVPRDISTAGDFLGPPPSYTLIRDPVLRLCHQMMAHSIAGRSQAPEKVTVTDLFYLRGMDVGSFVARLAEHFGLLTAEILGGLTVIALELLIIDMGELVRLQICMQVDDTWAWVAMGPERQADAAAGSLAVTEDAPAADEGDQAILALVQAPQQPPPPPPPAAVRTMPQRMAKLEEDVYEIRRALTEQREVIDAMTHDFFRFSTWVITGLGRMMDSAGVAYTPYSQTHIPYQRRVRCMTDEASTSTTQHDLQQPDP